MIKSGDLVRVVKPTTCCNQPFGIGTTYYVSKIVPAQTAYLSWYCEFCGRDIYCAGLALEVGTIDNAIEIERLKRIDPPALDDDAFNERELNDAGIPVAAE